MLSCSVVSDPLRPPTPGGLEPTRLPIHGAPQTRILESVAMSFSRGSSQPRDGTQASCIDVRFFTV